MTRTVLLDGDITAFQFSVTAEKAICWDDDLWTLHADAGPAIGKMDGWLGHLLERLEADRLVIALSDKENWRKDVLPSYKANRADVRKPMILGALRTHMTGTYETFIRPRLEGDDVLGILATSDRIVPGEKVIVSIDKDMKTIPGPLVNLKDTGSRIQAKEIGTWVEGIEIVTPDEADEYHLLQTLTGDATDNYSGCPGIGPETARKLLADPHRLVKEAYTPTKGKDKGTQQTRWSRGDACSPWECIVSYFNKAGLGEGEALIQARVARILRTTDYDFTKKEPILWLPPAS